MATTVGPNRYGKSGIRLVTVTREGARHHLRDLTVDVHLAGDFAASYVEGDNRAVLPTDTMKNMVYALARPHADEAPEVFAAVIGRRLLESTFAAQSATVELAEERWDRIAVAGILHDHAFTRGGRARRLAVVRVARDGVTFEAGIAGLGLLKSAGSGFSGFLRDAYTTLRDTRDRIFATELTARWGYAATPESFDEAWSSVRDVLLQTFAAHDSRSVQHTLHAMGTAALDACPAMGEIHLAMPNRHHLVVDLSPFGQENMNEVFVATEVPFGDIEATVTRG
jgi:urate oxidase